MAEWFVKEDLHVLSDMFFSITNLCTEVLLQNVSRRLNCCHCMSSSVSHLKAGEGVFPREESSCAHARFGNCSPQAPTRGVYVPLTPPIMTEQQSGTLWSQTVCWLPNGSSYPSGPVSLATWLCHPLIAKWNLSPPSLNLAGQQKVGRVMLWQFWAPNTVHSLILGVR